MADGNGFTTKEIVLDIRDTVRLLADKIDRIDRQGSIGTRAELTDHEERIRNNSSRLDILESSRVKREDIHSIRSDIAAINLNLSNRPQLIKTLEDTQTKVDSLESWRDNFEGERRHKSRFSDRFLAFSAIGVSFIWGCIAVFLHL